MQAVRFHEFGEPDVLRVEEIDVPEPADDELLVRVEAAGLNPKDLMNLEGIGGGIDDLTLPKTSGSDFAGVVIETGTEVDKFQKDDRVFGTGSHLFGGNGSFAEYVTAKPEITTILPDLIDFEVGGGLGIVGVTAWRALVDHGHIEPGDACLIHGANGGVGHMAVQISAAVGASTVATIGPERSGETIKRLGADTTVSYARDDLQAALDEAAESGYNTILDLRMDEYLPLDVSVAAYDADIVVIGGQTGAFQEGSNARRKNISVHQISVSNLVRQDSEPDLGPFLRKIVDLVESGRLSLEVARTYRFSEAAQAYRALANESFTGKVILKPDP